jgi:hypothetical protein
LEKNKAVLGHIALNLLTFACCTVQANRLKIPKGGICARQLPAAWVHEYLLKVLANGILM